MTSPDPSELLDRIALDREISSRSLLGFIRVCWEQVEKDTFQSNWHLEAITEHLQAVSRGEIRDLVINVPPGSMKSLAAAVFWSPWEWLFVRPSLRYIFATYSDSLSRRDALRTKTLVDRPWFRERFPELSFPAEGSRSMSELMTSGGGVRFATTIKGGVTGRHAHRIVVDDPIKPLDTIGSRAALGTELQMNRDWWDQTMSTRQADPKTTARVIVMQRLHEGDLAQHHLDSDREVVHLRIPMRYEPSHHCSTRIGFEDPREEEGELLWPDRMPEAEVRAVEKQLGSHGTAAQFQQRPNPLGGAVFRQEWFQFWGGPGCAHAAPPDRGIEIQSWDMTFKGKPTGGGKKRSFVCGQAWIALGGDFFLVDQERGQWEFVEACHALTRLTARRPRSFRKYIEDAANGPAVFSAMRRKVSGMMLVPTGGGSEARAQACSPLFESGNVWLPHPTIAPWVTDYLDELLSFPMGRHDDAVDCTSHALVILGESQASAMKTAMRVVRTGAMST